MPCSRIGNMALNVSPRVTASGAHLARYLEGDRSLDVTKISVVAGSCVLKVLTGEEMTVASPDVEPLERLISREHINLIAHVGIGTGSYRSHSSHPVCAIPGIVGVLEPEAVKVSFQSDWLARFDIKAEF